MEYSINLSTFQGPFDLLFYLIEKREVDIYDIPISEITEQYLAYLDEMKQLNLNITSEFILMAATLIEIKSKMLLPIKEKECEDPRLELVNQLLEYKICKYASERLKEFENNTNFYYTKPKEEIEVEDLNHREQFSINEVNVYELYNVFIKLLKEKDIQIVENTSKINKIYRDSFSVKDCVDSILVKLKAKPFVSVFALFKENTNRLNTKEYVVSIFLAVLELSKMKGIKIMQNDNFSDIHILSEN
ncbi:segregation/condensation protein A [Sedimentibacter sp. zth1]|uniref:segregation and condensation protein A n=1 Tax=Sedimentibacter sp. zth1 TaxID=2816908 RepID=UPI001A9258A7|nr:segregation/condensation protein A [Sedimentibacter sp. zth1]QSX06803.1 segregation/condensation protein A [Sedimentibacter sp. zth1]